MSTPDIVDITTACSTHGLVSTLGVVADHLPPRHTKGSSSCVTFTIKDSDIYDGNWRGGLKIKYFNDHESHLPPIRDDDVVLVRKVSVSLPGGNIAWSYCKPETDSACVGEAVQRQG